MRRVLAEILVRVRIVDCTLGRGARQVGRATLAVHMVIGSCHHIEVAHLVQQGAAHRIGAGQRRGPERPAHVDVVGLGRVDVGEVGLVAAAVDLHRLGLEAVLDRGEIVCDRGHARGFVRAEPVHVALALLLAAGEVFQAVGRHRRAGSKGVRDRGLLGVRAGAEGQAGTGDRRRGQLRHHAAARQAALDPDRGRVRGEVADHQLGSGAGFGARRRVAGQVAHRIGAGDLHFVQAGQLDPGAARFARRQHDVVRIRRRRALHVAAEVAHRLAVARDVEQGVLGRHERRAPFQQALRRGAGIRQRDRDIHLVALAERVLLGRDADGDVGISRQGGC